MHKIRNFDKNKKSMDKCVLLYYTVNGKNKIFGRVGFDALSDSRTGSCHCTKSMDEMLAVSSLHSAATKELDTPPFLWRYADEKDVLFFMQKQFKRTKKMVTVALLIALNIVIVRFLSIQTEFVRISFGFVPASLCSMLFGPWIGAGSAFLSDFLGMIVNSKGMAYFPGFGISEALYGLTYGLFLYRRKKSYLQISVCVGLQTIFIDIALGTLWLWMLFHNPVWVTVTTRITSAIVTFPIKVIGIQYTWKLIGARIDSLEAKLF